MTDIKTYKTKDLVLKIKDSYDPQKLNLDKWSSFIDVLCGDRIYQKEAIFSALIYIASGNYRNIEDLVHENWISNPELSQRYKNAHEYEAALQLPRKLSGVIDLATGTGKSYVMYGIAQIALGIGLVEKVLVLCPSITIEKSLKEKFQNLSGDAHLKEALPSDSALKNPRIIDANSTITKGDIAVENIHAVYDNTGSSIEDSLMGEGKTTLVLSDEVHHAYNSSTDKDIRKWKGFLLDSNYNFQYVLGFTGTAYSGDLYFNDVIYRYSLRKAVDDQVVKSIDYVSKDESISTHEKFQKIYSNHKEFVSKYRDIKPLTILVTKDIRKAVTLREDFIDFLKHQEGLTREAVEQKVLIVTSHKDHRKNILQLSSVDDGDNPTEWIISVSMLTEGWDVKNVFQIVPWEDRAFNSKLLIAQVLGRGLRMPSKYTNPQPKVRVFNHDSWSRSIHGLVDEILEIEVRLTSSPLLTGERAKYHFALYNIDYKKTETVVKAKNQTREFDYSKGYTNLASQVERNESITEYEDLKGGIIRKPTTVAKETLTVEQVVNKIVDTFKTRDFEAQIRFPKGTYRKENLPPKKEIHEYVINSMKRAGIHSNVLVQENASRIFKAFQTLFRAQASTIKFDRQVKKPKQIDTKSLARESVALSSIRQGATVFYTEDYEMECTAEQLDILEDVIEDDSLPRSASREVNLYSLKTPVSVVITKQSPERKFVELLTSLPLSSVVESWIKSRDQNFYSIEFSWRRGEHATQGYFNPDFFLKFDDKIVVVEIKADKDDSDENKAKHRWAKEHFAILNKELSSTGIKQEYFFHFLSPSSYMEFAEYAKDGRLFKNEFRSELENLLE